MKYGDHPYFSNIFNRCRGEFHWNPRCPSTIRIRTTDLYRHISTLCHTAIINMLIENCNKYIFSRRRNINRRNKDGHLPLFQISSLVSFNYNLWNMRQTVSHYMRIWTFDHWGFISTLYHTATANTQLGREKIEWKQQSSVKTCYWTWPLPVNGSAAQWASSS